MFYSLDELPRRTLVALLVSFPLLLALPGCGNGTGYGLEALASVPKITDPVLTSTSAAAALQRLEFDLLRPVMRGGGSGSSSGSGSNSSSSPTIWPSNLSRSYCITGQSIANAWTGAAAADYQLCAITAQEPHYGANLFDGNYHYLLNSSAGVTPSFDGKPYAQYRIKGTVNSSGKVATMELSICGNDTISQVLKFTRVDSSQNNQSTLRLEMAQDRYQVIGTLNSKGQWEGTKQITANYNDTVTEGIANLMQTSNQISVSSWTSVFGPPGTEATRELTVSDSELLGSAPNLYALGDGALNQQYINGPSGPSPIVTSSLVAWLGSTEQPVSQPDSNPSVQAYYDAVKNATLPSANPSGDTVGFDVSAWDCSIPSGQTAIGWEGNYNSIDDLTACQDTYGDNGFETTFGNVICWNSDPNQTP